MTEFEFIAAVPKSVLVYTLVSSSLAEKLCVCVGGGSTGSAGRGTWSRRKRQPTEPLTLRTTLSRAPKAGDPLSVGQSSRNTRRSGAALCCPLCGSPPRVSRLVAYAASFLSHISSLTCHVRCLEALQGNVWLKDNHILSRLERDA